VFKNFDGSGRKPRQVQEEALSFIEANKDKKVIAITAPCGSGKSAIAKAVMDEFKDAAYITSENSLVQQMSKFYPDLNVLIGKKHYKCSKSPGVSCEVAWQSRKHKACDNCAYYKARIRAIRGKEPTCFNAISYYYAQKDPFWTNPKVVIVDEADKLVDLLMLISGEVFNCKYQPPKSMEFIEIADWLRTKAEVLQKLVDVGKNVDKNLNEYMRVTRLIDAIETSPSHYTHSYEEDGSLVVYPIDPPRELIDRILNCDLLILMSATLYKSDIEELTTLPYAHIELASPIDEARRRVVVDTSVGRGFNSRTDAAVIAEWVKKVIANYPGRNTVVHVTYSLSKKLKPHFKEAYVNTPENKEEVLKSFTETGGLWLASGASEGLDLYGDLCRLNIVPVLPRPNIMDPVQKRRLALPHGSWRYNIRVIKTIQQQAGRSTRNEEDESKVVIAGTGILSLASEFREDLPKGFTETLHRRNHWIV
jgi:Rad3-related DNA helicase